MTTPRRLVPPLVGVVCAAALACRPIGPREGGGGGAGEERLPEAPIVAVERGAGGARLVLVDDAGRRVATLTDAPGGPDAVVDLMPAWSPDGRWVAFASSRARGSLERWSLWIVDASRGGEPVRLTSDDDAVDGWPAWSPDGRTLVFASTRAGGDFDLWTLAVDGLERGAPAPGTLRALTDDDGEEIEPAWAPAGDVVAFTWRHDGARVIATVPAGGGAPRAFSSGPEDQAPRFAPDGRTLVFVAPAPGRADRDVWAVDVAGGERRVVVSDDLGDEQAPRFTRDGHFLLATSVVRDDDGSAVAATLVVADLDERPVRWRALSERLPVARIGADTGPTALDRRTVHDNPSYAEALRLLLVPAAPDDEP